MANPGNPTARAQPRTLQPVIDNLHQYGDRTLVQAWRRDTAETWSYGSMADKVLRLAGGLRERLEPGQSVALYAPAGPEWIAAALAVIRAGMVLVPVDLQFEGENLRHVLADADAGHVFSRGRHAETLHEAVNDLVIFRLDSPEEGERGFSRRQTGWQEIDSRGGISLPEPGVDETAILFYTSGTTGPPKGVPLSHGNIAFQLRAVADTHIVAEGDRVLLPLPLHHVYPLVVGLLTPLYLGLTVIQPYALTGKQLVRAMGEGRATVIVGVPRLYGALYDGIRARAQRAGPVGAGLLHGTLAFSRFAQRWGLPVGESLMRPVRARIAPTLRLLAAGGAPLDEALAGNLTALGWSLAIGYGLTETSPLLTINTPRGARLGSVGRPVPGIEIRVDPKAAESIPAGEGEIQARGPGVFAGYRNLPDKTREAFTADGWFRTGDLGYRDHAGYLYITGRLSTLIVTAGGENIQPDTLEARYAGHPAIREIGVLQHDGRLVALAVPADAGDDAGGRVRKAVTEVAASLPSYMRLGHCAISREPLPRTQLGKIQRHRLEKLYEERLRDASAETKSAGPLPVAKMSGADRALLEEPAARAAWQYLAERYADKTLTPDSDLQLDLDIDSLEWVLLTLDITERTGVELDESVIADARTVLDLLEMVIDAESPDRASAEIFRAPERVLSARQRRWLQPPAVLRPVAPTLYAVNRMLVRTFLRPRVHGLEQVPEQGPFILACNHDSVLDPFIIAAALPGRQLRHLYWAGWTGMAFSGPVRRLVSRTAQVVPIDPHRGALSSLAFAGAVLDRGHGLIWFPEGGRSPTGELQPFRAGIGLLLKYFPVPVLPAVIRGSFEVMPLGRRLPRPGPVELHFGEILDPRQLADVGERSPRAIADALHEHVRGLQERAASPGPPREP